MLQGCDLYAYNLTLARKWNIGKKYKNNGVLIALCTQLQKITIQNGYGIEPILSDQATDFIIQNSMIPEFRNNDYFAGVEKGLQKIIKSISRKYNVSMDN